jgi:2-polyprenyl-3-methyl-5-hydroxy-6-metoxy-1,4-benzoquinol methylase
VEARSKRQRTSTAGDAIDTSSDVSYGHRQTAAAVVDDTQAAAGVVVRATPMGDPSSRPHTRSIEDLRWHFPMLNDHERNGKLCAAVETAVAAAGRRLRARGESRGVRVLDIGAGSGLLALAAARAGAV